MANFDDIEYLFKENYARMHCLAAMILHDSDTAHDIVHDVFVSILAQETEISYDTAYLMRSVRNRCMNRLKAIDVRNRFREFYLIENEEFDHLSDWPDEELLEQVENCESFLSNRCAEVFKLRFQTDMSAKEISKKLGIGERIVYKHLQHALQILKQKLNG